jgi:hypothetical protein
MGLFSKKRPVHDATTVWDPGAPAPRIVCSCGWELQYGAMREDMTPGETRQWADELCWRLEKHEATGE